MTSESSPEIGGQHLHPVYESTAEPQWFGSRLQPLHFALFPKFIQRPVEFFQVMCIWCHRPISMDNLQHKAEFVSQPLLVVLCNELWLSRERNSFFPNRILRRICFMSGAVGESLLQPWEIDQFPLGVPIGKTALHQCKNYC